MSEKVLIIGAGLAGSDAAMYLARAGVEVVLIECKTIKLNPAQKISTFGELVCTNSLKSKTPGSAHGLLKYEMQEMGSLIIEKAHEHAVPAGDALAVDREIFSQSISDELNKHPLITIVEEEASDIEEMKKRFECSYVIVASGPLTTDKLSSWIEKNITGEDFYFYDAIAPVVDADSLDFSILYYKDRHKEVSDEEGVEADYLNVPLNKEQYNDFIKELVAAEKVPAKDFEDYKFFESCLPIDIMAERGPETARFSCMKPIGLELKDGSMAHAVVQLRKENLLGSAFNLVGFQTRLTYKEQLRVFRMLPGFSEASFIHLGSVHRNSFINAKVLLNNDLSSKKFPELYFAGQISGVEGYTESASMGLYVAHQILRKIKRLENLTFPVETGIGALVNYIMTAPKPCPSNINFGLLPAVKIDYKKTPRKLRKKVKKAAGAARAKECFDNFKEQLNIL